MLRRRPRTSAGKYRLYCNLGYNLSEEVVRRYFQQLCTQGQILDVYIPRHNSGRNKGYGFATFEKEADLLDALKSSEHVIEGNVVKINRAGPRPDYDRNALQQDQQQNAQASMHGKGPRLYVGGIPDDVHEDDIKSHFERWGNVVDIYFPGKSGLKRVNYCFVTFDTWHAAQQSCTQSERSINSKPVQSISLAEERTADARDVSQGNLLAEAGLSPLGLHGLPDWTQQFGNLSLHQLPGLDSSHQSLLPMGPFPDSQESYPVGGGQQIISRAFDNSLGQHVLLQAMQQHQQQSVPRAHAQSGLPEQQSHLPSHISPQTRGGLAGYEAIDEMGVLHGSSYLGRGADNEIQGLQQAIKTDLMPSFQQAYPPAPQGWRPEQADTLYGQQLHRHIPPGLGHPAHQHSSSNRANAVSGDPYFNSRQ